MPRNMMSDFSGMVCEIPPEVQFGSLEKKRHLESGKSRPRRRGSTLDDDETMKYLTHEEKDVLLFFEETIDSLEDDLEEQALCDSSIQSHSPRSTEENMSSLSESEDIIDLVQSSPKKCVPSGTTEEPWKLDNPKLEYIEPPDEGIHTDTAAPCYLQPSAPPLPIYEALSAPPPVQHPKLLSSIPTPLVIAQKISEKQSEGSPFSPAFPKESKPSEKRSEAGSSSLQNGERWNAFKPSVPPPTAPKPHRFPSNISITNISEREFSKTISQAAVSVQERKARVLANVNSSPSHVSELEERLQKHELLRHNRSSSLRDLISEHAREDALSRLSMTEESFGQSQLNRSLNIPSSKDEKPKHVSAVSSNGYRTINEILKRESTLFPNVSKTVTVKPGADIVDSKPPWQNGPRSFYDHRQTDLSLDMRRRSGSLPRPPGLRPQGITVQFSGRGSTEEARREALRKLGLLKD